MLGHSSSLVELNGLFLSAVVWINVQSLFPLNRLSCPQWCG